LEGDFSDRKDMLHVLVRGKRYRLVSKRLPASTGGYCEPPDKAGKQIAVCSSVRSPNVLLENLIHELLHASHWDLDESAIRETGECIARALIRAGVQVDVKKIHAILAEKR
jgi:hypothetical protein